MYGEPSVMEYARMLQDADNRISNNGFRCSHNNTGWLGYYITTPSGEKYQLVKKSIFGDDGYYLCDYTPKSFCTGMSLGLYFKDIDDCKAYLKKAKKYKVYFVIKKDGHGYLNEKVVVESSQKKAIQKVRETIKKNSGRTAFNCTVQVPIARDRGIEWNGMYYPNYDKTFHALW